MKQMTILPFDHHSDHTMKPVVFILSENIAKRLFFVIFQCKNNTFASFKNISPIVFILSEHVTKNDYMPYG